MASSSMQGKGEEAHVQDKGGTYLPGGEEGSWAEEGVASRVCTPKELINAEVTLLGISPVPEGNSKTIIPGHLLDFPFPKQQEEPMPRQKARSLMGKVYVGPHTTIFQESIPGGVVMQPHKQIVAIDICEHRIGAIVHLLVSAGGNNIVWAGGTLGQVEVGDKLVLLSRGHPEDLLSYHVASNGAVCSCVAKPALTAIVAHEVTLASACPVVEDNRPVFSIINARERELGTYWGVGGHYILAHSPA